MAALVVLVGLAVLIGAAGCEAPRESARSVAPSASAPAETPTPSPSPTPTPAPTPSPPPAGGTYLALGDSLAVGAGATSPDETGYVARLRTALSGADASPRVTVHTNLAVSGETSTSMIRDGQLVDALDAIEGAEPPVALVTLDIGGNDLLRLLGTDACATDPLGADCLQLLALTLTDFEANYRQIVGELIGALSEHASEGRLAVMTYFNPFSGTDAGHEAAAELALLGRDGRLDCETDDPQARGMNDIIACIGDELGAIAVDVQPAFVGLGLELTHIGSEDIHANDRGYDVIGQAFLAALEEVAAR